MPAKFIDECCIYFSDRKKAMVAGQAAAGTLPKPTYCPNLRPGIHLATS
jgi:hypothetical protein